MGRAQRRAKDGPLDQLFNILDEDNRFKIGEAVSAPWNAPETGAVPTMDGFVTDYISTLTAEVGRQPTYEEYAQIMTGYTPEQVPGPERDREGLRGVRPLVLRGALTDVHEPLLLGHRDVVGVRDQRVKDRLATNFVSYSEFERDAVNGTLPDFSLIEPNMLSGHSDYHPAFGRSLIPDDMDIPMDPGPTQTRPPSRSSRPCEASRCRSSRA